MDSQRKLLESLMSGIIPDAKRSYQEPGVCPHHLVAFCPYQLFNNTKVAMGSCGYRIHDDDLAKDYRASGQPNPTWEANFFTLIEGLVYENDRLVQRSKAKVEMEQAIFDQQRHAQRQREREQQRRHLLDPREQDELLERIIVLETTLPELYRKIPIVAESGDLAQAIELMIKGDVGKHEKAQLVNRRDGATRHQAWAEAQSNAAPTSGTAINTVCDVCGGILGNESTVWLDSHMSGKQHLGFRYVRDAYEEFVKKGFTASSKGRGQSPSFTQTSAASSHSRGDSYPSSSARHQQPPRQYDRHAPYPPSSSSFSSRGGGRGEDRGPYHHRPAPSTYHQDRPARGRSRY